jgi:hypothetical protein
MIVGIQLFKKDKEKDQHVMKQTQLEEKTTKKRFHEQWSSKRCGKLGDVLHLGIKMNLLLATKMYHVPFFKFAPLIYKCNMQFTIAKCKVRLNGQYARHIALIELS